MAFLLMIPLFLIRFGLLGALDKGALARAAHFAPLVGREKIAYGVYQIAHVALIVYPCFLGIELEPSYLFVAGCIVYGAGIVLLVASTVQFARPSASGLLEAGVYRISRNPMYVAYFLYFLGCALLTQSPALLVLVLVFQAAAHFIIKAEERECEATFGDEYRAYCQRVRRYL